MQMRDVLEPNRATEFEIQAEIWAGLRAIGINARGEVKVPYAGLQGLRKKPRSKRMAVCRFDLAIFEAQRLIGIIEVKAAPPAVAVSKGWKQSRQARRYTDFGVPVLLVRGEEQARHLLASCSAAGGMDWSWRMPA